uniref:Nuclear pore complex protein Nup85 n=1 Tax=Meloidogyne incognita TaxID=6306 RepID=A0A914KYR5_MELIC
MSVDLQQTQQNNLTTQQGKQYHPVQYCLFYDFFTVFAKGQSIIQNIQSGSVRLEGALLLSKRYKAALKRAIKMLEQSDIFVDSSQTDVLQLGEELCSVNLIWSLIEAVSIRPSNNLISIDLLEWARECFPSTQSVVPSSQEGRPHETSFLSSIMESLMQQEKPELHDSYWNAVIRQAIVADFETVATLLQFHSEYKTNEHIRKMVKILNAANDALFKHDRTNCEEFLSLIKKIRDFTSQNQLGRLNDNLAVICSLVIGDKGTFRKYFDIFRPSWFEVLPAFLLFFYPSVDDEQLPRVIERLFELLGLARHQLSKIEQTVLAILELDLIRALKIICSAGPSLCWFAVHLVDLLHFHDPNYLNPEASNISSFQLKFIFQDESDKEKENLDLRSRLLVEYCQLLFQNDQLWEIGADYLIASNLKNCNEMLEKIIGQFNWFGNVSIAEKILIICEKYELWNAREDILKAITMKYCHLNEWSTALNWALRMQNRNSLAAHVAKRILQGAIPSSKIGQMRIFESMADQFVDCSELVLLYKFYTFKRRLCEGNLRQAIQLLHELFIDNSSPIEFHVTLAEETARLLNAFQQELLSTEPFDPATRITGLDKESIQDMFRALSMFQLQQNLLESASIGEKESQQQSSKQQKSSSLLFSDSSLPSLEVYKKLEDLIQTLRPMLAELLALSCLTC